MMMLCQRFLLILFCVAFASISYADNLGRIFTSVEERKKLEKVRQKKETPVKAVIEEVKSIVEPVVKKEIINRDTITLKGLVHRVDGKSTAWINDTNTFEGDLDSQFIQVPDNKIKSDNVTIIMPDDSTNVELRVGEAFVPKPIEREVINTEGEM